MCAKDSKWENAERDNLGLIDGPRNLMGWHQHYGHHVGNKTYTLEKHCDLRNSTDKLLVPELVFRVSEQLDEGNQSTPWVRTMHDEALQ